MEDPTFLRRHIEKIVSLTDTEFDIVSSYFTSVEVKRKQLLSQRGNKVSSEFLVVKGLLKAYTFDELGKEHIIQFAMENWWISDYPAYADQKQAELYVQAMENCLVLELKQDDKKQMCERVPKMYHFHGHKAFGGFVALQKRVLSMMKNSAHEKYELLLEQYPELFQRVSKTMIAHYLGVSRETLSRLQRK